MTFVAAAIVGSAAIGAVSARNASKRASAAQDRATEASMESFRFSKPYIQHVYDKGQNELSRTNAIGVYDGQTYAGPNQFQIGGNIAAGNFGQMGLQGAHNIMRNSQGFADNYNALLGQTQDDQMKGANEYALNNSQGLIDAAMRNDYRNLTESTLPGINNAASMSGNMNSSRAGVADAIARRDFDDRYADTTATINEALRNDYLDQQNKQFDQAYNINNRLADSYGLGMNAFGSFADMMTGAGANLQGFDQAALNDARQRFEDNRDFRLDNIIKYKKGILDQADYRSKDVQPNYHDKGSATFGGAMQGMGMGLDLVNSIRGLRGPGGGNSQPNPGTPYQGGDWRPPGGGASGYGRG